MTFSGGLRGLRPPATFWQPFRLLAVRIGFPESPYAVCRFMKTKQHEPTALVPGEDFYMEDGLLVMTAAYHRKRGSCCGSGCRWCPFEPKHEQGATRLAADESILISDEKQS